MIKKKVNYFKNSRIELLDLIPLKNKNANMLEIGAGGGNTLIYAKKHAYAKNISAVELYKIDNSYQNSKEFDDFIIGDIENIELPFDKNHFDVIICADVLEHLKNPYTIVEKLYSYLSKDGIIIASLPNIRYWRIIKTIFIDGDFKYTDAGILDQTHLRFFCKKNMIELFEKYNFKIVHMSSSIEKTGFKSKIFNNLTRRIFEEFLTEQYYIVADKNG
jgi:2-polyprenyl-3-methyl-5-hydroxy-6-metoxy-1,4-benzoquinol methylase